MQKVELLLQFFFRYDVLENGFFISNLDQVVLKSDLNSERLRIIFHEFGVFGNDKHSWRGLDKLRWSGYSLSFLPFGGQKVHDFLSSALTLEG
jgi:hypothetical protein